MNTLLVALARICRAALKPFRNVRGFWALSEIFVRLFNRELEVVIRDFDGKSGFACRLNEHMSSHIFWRGLYSRDQLLLLDSLLEPDMVFVDGGANQGEFTIFVARRLPAGRVYSFEPVTGIREKLNRNIGFNDFQNINVVPLGLSDKKQTATIYTANWNRDLAHHEGLPTVYALDDRNIPLEDIQLVKLDDFFREEKLDRLDVIKLDIEGAEFAALRGARSTILKHKPIIIVEVGDQPNPVTHETPQEMLTFIIEMGYSLERIKRMGRTEPLDIHNLEAFQNVICRVVD